MTILIGVLCREGVIIGADSSATFGPSPQNVTIEQPYQKIDVVGEHVIVAGTGQIGLGQRFTDIVKMAWNNSVFQKVTSPIEIVKTLCAAGVKDFSSTQAPNEYGALVAFPYGGRAHLCEFAVRDFQPELKNERLWYVSMGSGQSITDPFLALMRRVFWHNDPPSCQDAVFAVTWALQHAIDVNPGGINGPLCLAELAPQKKGRLQARMIPDGEIGEHLENVEGAIVHLRTYPTMLQGKSDAPDVPRLSS